MNTYYLLVFSYLDNSAFYICGLTQSYAAAQAWNAAGNGEHRVYPLKLDEIKDHSVGHDHWGKQ